jgi:hypothetical protein
MRTLNMEMKAAHCIAVTTSMAMHMMQRITKLRTPRKAPKTQKWRK